MADDIIEQQAETQVAETQVTEPTQEQQIAEQMNFRLNGGEPPIESAEKTETVAEQVTQTEPPVFQFQTFTEKYGWQSPEDAAKEIEELRALKENHVVAEPKFENDQSKALFNAIQAGKSDEVFEILAQQKKLDALTTSEITKDNADAIVKLGMQLKYKDLTESEIEYKFKKQFGLPKEPVMGDLDDEDEFKDKHNEWKDKVAEIEMEKIIEAKLAKPELEAAKSKLVLPNIAAEVDEDYIQYKESLEKSATIDAETKEAYKAFQPKDIETRVNFKDEANKIEFEFHYEPDVEGFKQSLDLVMDTQKYFEKYKGQDGSPNRKQFLQDIYFIQNKEKIIMAAMNQAKNATLKSQLPDNSQGSFQRQQPTGQEPSELHKYMQAAGVVKN
jgi:hypothetical protein